VGGAVYGNAGAYGRSMHEVVDSVRYCDYQNVVEITGAACEFEYRGSVFKRRKDRVILSATLRLTPAPSADLRRIAEEIRKVRDAKYPPTMKCAGSIFKNCFVAKLPEAARAAVPPALVREGKVPSAFFLEQAGAKGMRRGDIHVAAYHANLIYNDGAGTAADLRELISCLKERVRERFGLELEEEVQFVGF
jgi:UDP-N-acetylmuramate dehydrogenase